MAGRTDYVLLQPQWPEMDTWNRISIQSLQKLQPENWINYLPELFKNGATTKKSLTKTSYDRSALNNLGGNAPGAWGAHSNLATSNRKNFTFSLNIKWLL